MNTLILKRKKKKNGKKSTQRADLNVRIANDGWLLIHIWERSIEIIATIVCGPGMSMNRRETAERIVLVA